MIYSNHSIGLKFIICGDINIDYLTEDDKKRQFDPILFTYNLASIVHFSTISQGSSSTAIDNTFIDTN